MEKLTFETRKKRGILDITDEIEKLVLGTWQRVILVELDGPRRRQVVCTVMLEQNLGNSSGG